MALKFYTSVEKELKLKVRKFCRLIPAFVEVEKNSSGAGLGGGGGCSLHLE